MTRMVILIVDALGARLAESSGVARDVLSHTRPVETVLGFSSGALPTLFSGLPPEAHGRWVMYRRARDTDTPFRGFGALGLLPPRLQRSWKLGRLLHRVVERRGVRGYFQLYEVPRPMLASFDLAERADLFAPGALGVDTLWDSLVRRGVRWRAWSWRSPEAQALAAVEDRLANGDEQVLVAYTADLDAALHREGSGGRQVRERLEGYAAWLGRVEQIAVRRGERLWLYLVSDHGMVDVTRKVDVMAALRGAGVVWPRDVLAFFDSTMARFWWRKPGVRDTVRAVLGPELGGRWLSEADLAAAGCRFPDHAFGDDVYLLDPGVLLVPSFMGATPVAAMHGYAPSHPDMAAFLASNRALPGSVTRLADVRPFLESELDALAREAS